MKPALAALLLCALFILISVPWIDKPGIQTDEALFAEGIYPPFSERDYPIMVMSYVGALKARLWAPIFRVWPPSPASVRIPAVLLGALSIWLVFCLMSTIVGNRAALAATALLATDPIYIQYSRYDHGPVVIQHLCLTGAMLALARFDGTRRLRWLATGFFALGLGMWEKAIFAWLIAGLVLAGLVVFGTRIRMAASIRTVTVAAAAFAAGASPLIFYNVRNNLITFRGNTVWSADDVGGKARLLRGVLEGEALFGSMIRESWEGPVREPETAAAKAIVAISTAAGSPRRSLTGYLAVAALLLLPLLWRTAAGTTARFALIAGGSAWLQMAFLKGAGGGAHHTILLWPLPAIGIASVLAAASRKAPWGRLALVAAIGAGCIANLLVLSSYYTNLLRNGGTASWTDAMYPAFEAIHNMDKETVCTIDWGFLDTLRMFERGRTNLCAAADPVDNAGRRNALFQISRPGYVFLTHTEGNESFPGVTARFVHFAESMDFRRVQIREFADSNGRKTVEIFRFAARQAMPCD